jgi:hypothetical protein
MEIERGDSELLLMFWDYMCENSIADRSEYTLDEQREVLEAYIRYTNDNP